VYYGRAVLTHSDPVTTYPALPVPLQNGLTPLHYAAAMGHTLGVHALLGDPHVDPGERNEVRGARGVQGDPGSCLPFLPVLQYGLTPLDLARDRCHADIVRMLEAHRSPAAH